VLLTSELDGEERKGLARASETGWVYLLDRETGEPLLPIPKRPAPLQGVTLSNQEITDVVAYVTGEITGG
jgi:glucose dehydrogenase